MHVDGAGRIMPADERDPRRKLILMCVGGSALALAVSALRLWPSVLLTEGSDSPVSLDLMISTWLVVGASLAFWGASYGPKKVGGGIRRLAVFLGVDRRDGAGVAAWGLWKQPVRPESRLDSGALLAVMVWAVMNLWWLVASTGGPAASPFLQFAISAFLWAMIVTRHGRAWVFAVAMGWLVLIFAFEGDASVVDFEASWFAIISLINLAFQFAFVMLESGRLETAAQAAGSD